MDRYDKTKRIAFVYYLYINNEVVYVGKTTNLSNRIWSHSRNKDFDKFSFVISDIQNYSKLEKSEIKKLHPIQNIIQYKEAIRKLKIKQKPNIGDVMEKLYDNLITHRVLLFDSKLLFAKKSNISIRTISSFENYNAVSSSTIKNITRSLGLEIKISIDNNIFSYSAAIQHLNKHPLNIFTQKELAEHFDVSIRKLSDFQNGKIIDFWLLTQYAAIIGKKVNFNLL